MISNGNHPASAVHAPATHPPFSTKMEKDTVYMPSSVAARLLGDALRSDGRQSGDERAGDKAKVN